MWDRGQSSSKLIQWFNESIIVKLKEHKTNVSVGYSLIISSALFTHSPKYGFLVSCRFSKIKNG
jgi:hypothetical protein